MIIFCPSCWSECKAKQKVCPTCGADLESLDRRGFSEKLISALRHPEPLTAVRAAWILGQIKEKAAVPQLIEVLSSSQDPYIQESAALALGKIGDGKAFDILAKKLSDPRAYLIVRLAAAKALEMIEGQ
ncbi:MAG: HEAT repeat domain-containing protein [Firmicutes bacterium]|nr:HEAT repeat domain-containing protein [Bacillota bacterium]